MQDEYIKDLAIVEETELEATSVMQSTPTETVKSILGRLGVGYKDGLPKETYLSALKEEFCADSKWILLMLPGVILDFLMEVWENAEVPMEEDRWNYMQYLKIFGLLTYRRGNQVMNAPNRIYVISEMKERFYFLLRSRKSDKQMDEYEEWEKYIVGLMYYYGFMDIRILHAQFLKASGKLLGYEDFLLFLKCRCSLWAFGEIVRDIQGKHEYFQSFNVENAEMLLTYVREQGALPYKKIEPEDLIYISEASGIDNRWAGLSELGTILVDKMGLNYYRTTVLIKTLIQMIQNGCAFNKLTEKLRVFNFDERGCMEQALEAVHDLYESVPVFEYKGHSRKEYQKLSRKRQREKKKNLFTIIDGGKTI